MSIYPKEIVNEVLTHLDPITTLKFINYKLDTIQDHGDVIKCFCPVHKETVFRTLMIENNQVSCKYNLCPAAECGDLVNLVALTQEIDYDQALRDIVSGLELPIQLPPPAEFIERTLEIAENFLELSVLDEAEIEFKKILQVQPDNFEALEGLAEVYREDENDKDLLPLLRTLMPMQYDAGHQDKAISHAQEILKFVPQDFETRLKLANCFIDAKQAVEANSELMILATTYEEVGNYSEAYEIYQKLQGLNYGFVDLQPFLLEALAASERKNEALEESLKMASVEVKAGNFGGAICCYKNALELDPSQSNIRLDLVNAALKDGIDDSRMIDCLDVVDYYLKSDAATSAEEILQRLKSQAPDSVPLMQKEIELLKRQGRDDAADKLQTQLIEKFYDEGNERKAWRMTVDLFNQIQLSGNDNSIEILELLSTLCCKMQDSRLATRIILHRVELYRENNNIDGMLDGFDELRKIVPEEPAFLVGALHALLECGDENRALDYSSELQDFYDKCDNWVPLSDALQQGLDLSPENSEWRFKLAQTLDKLGRRDWAMEEFLKAAKSFVDSENWEPARLAINSILNIFPRHPEALKLSAETYLAQEKRSLAITDFSALAVGHIEKQEHSKANEILEKLSKLESDSLETLQLQAELFQSSGNTEQLIEVLLKLSKEHIRREDFTTGIECATSILDHSPDHFQAIELLIQAFDSTNKSDSALEMKLRLGEIYHSQEKFDLEIQLYNSVIENEPGNWKLKSKLIQVLIETHRIEDAAKNALDFVDTFGRGKQKMEAVEVASMVLHYNADQPELHRAVADLYRAQGMTKKWIGQMTQLISCYARRNNHVEIAQIYEDLVHEEPGNINFRSNLIDAYTELKQFNQARAHSIDLANYYRESGSPVDASNALRHALEFNKEDEELLEQLDEILQKSGNQEDRISILKQLSDAYLKHGKTAPALTTLRSLIDLDPSQTDAREKILHITSEQEATDLQVQDRVTLANELVKQEKFDKAIETLQATIEIKPDDIDIRRSLVRAFVAANNTESAVSELGDIIGMLDEKESNDEIMRCINEILKLDPQNIEARKSKAETFARMGQDKKALEEYMKLSGEIDSPTKTPFSDTDKSADINFDELCEMMPFVDEYNFENFIAGDTNNFARSTCEAVAKAPARHYNPVFLWSDVGLGKTHLVNAIANYLIKNDPHLKLHYTNGEAFTSQIIDAISQNSLTKLRSYYKRVDVLIVDDIHFLAGKEKAQEEFFHIFNQMFQSKKQIVITCDCPPKDIAKLEKRLKSRFGAGVIVDIQPPDLETRIAILKNEAANFPDLEIDNAILQLVCDKIESNVRELKAAFNQMMVKTEMSNRKLDEDLAQEILSQIND